MTLLIIQCVVFEETLSVLCGRVIKSYRNNDVILQKVKGQLFSGKMYKESETDFFFFFYCRNHHRVLESALSTIQQ